MAKVSIAIYPNSIVIQGDISVLSDNELKEHSINIIQTVCDSIQSLEQKTVTIKYKALSMISKRYLIRSFCALSEVLANNTRFSPSHKLKIEWYHEMEDIDQFEFVQDVSHISGLTIHHRYLIAARK